MPKPNQDIPFYTDIIAPIAEMPDISPVLAKYHPIYWGKSITEARLRITANKIVIPKIVINRHNNCKFFLLGESKGLSGESIGEFYFKLLPFEEEGAVKIIFDVQTTHILNASIREKLVGSCMLKSRYLKITGVASGGWHKIETYRKHG